MDYAVWELGVLDEMPPEAWMNTEVHEGATGLEYAVGFGEYRADVVDVCVQVGGDDCREGGIRERNSLSIRPNEVACAALGHAQLITRDVNSNYNPSGRSNGRVMEAAPASQVQAEA